MKRILRNCLCVLLSGVLLLSLLSAGVAWAGLADETTQIPTVPTENGSFTVDLLDDETALVPINPGTASKRVLYSWTASDLTKDSGVFSSNLTDDSDPQQRWNESAVMYTGQETKQMVLHTFLNKPAVGKDGVAYGLAETRDAYGRTAVDNLMVDLYPMAETAAMGAVGLSFVYAYKPADNGLNPANSGLLRIYVSEDGQTWSKDYVTVRSAHILGSGTTQDNESVIYYQVFSENLLNIDSLTAGDEIKMLRIMPDGESGIAGGTFSLCSLSLTGYGQIAEFTAAVPAEAGSVPVDTCRTAMLDAAKNSTADTDLGRILDALSLVTQAAPETIPDMLDTLGLRFMDGIAVKATEDVKEIFEWMYADGLRSREADKAILAEYETITTTQKLLQELNTPQQVFKAYAACKPGDLLVQVTDTGSHAYMVVSSAPAYSSSTLNSNSLNAKLSIDPDTSMLTYLDAGKEETATFLKLYSTSYLVPMVVDALADNAVQPARVDGHVSVADGVRVAVSSNWDMVSYTLSMDGFSYTVNQPGTAGIYTSAELDEFVAELDPGTYEMTVDVKVNGGMAQPAPIVLDFTVSEEVELFDIVGTTMTLGNTLSIDFVIDTAKLTGTDNYAQITKHYADGRADQTVRVDQADWVAFNQTTQPTYYYASFTGIAAKEMCDNVDVVFYNGQDQAVTNVKTDSMQSYAMRMLNKNDVINNTILRTLYVDMLNYGAQAQLAFEYDVSNLANRLLSTEQRGYATAEVTAQNHQVKDGCVYGTSLTLENQILLDVVIDDSKIDSYDGVYAEATYTNHYGDEKTVYVNQVKKFNDYYHYMSVSGMAIADCRQMVTLTLYNSSDEIIGTFTDSVEGYVARTKTEIGDAILKFGQSSYNYFHP